jgi:hypothetical protein
MDCNELINGIGEKANIIPGSNILGGASDIILRVLIKFLLIPLAFQK